MASRACRWCSDAASTTNSAVSSHATRSASSPTAIRPLRAARPASSAGAVAPTGHRGHVVSAALARAGPRRRQQQFERGDAAPRREEVALGKRFSDGGHGEWSVATSWSVPSAQAFHRASRCAADRSGGAHLYAVAPRGHGVAVERQVVQASLGADGQPRGARGRDHGRGLAASHVHHVHARPDARGTGARASRQPRLRPSGGRDAIQVACARVAVRDRRRGALQHRRATRRARAAAAPVRAAAASPRRARLRRRARTRPRPTDS